MMLMLRRRLVVYGIVLAACVVIPRTASAGYRLQVHVIPLDAAAGEQSIVGADVCIYHAGDASEYFSRFFHSDEVRCYGADQILDMPAGAFLLYAHVGNRLVSPAPYLINVTVPNEEVLRRYAVEVVPAATLDFATAIKDLPQGTYPAVYLPNDGYSRFVSNALPLPHGSTQMLVPAGQTVLPLLVGNDRIKAVADPVKLTAGRQFTLAANAFESKKATVVALVTLKNFGGRLPAPQLEPLRIALVRKGDPASVLTPAIPLRKNGLFDRSLVIFRAVRPGDYRLEANGDLWRSDEIDVDVGGAGVIRAPHPLSAEPASTLTVQWTADGAGNTLLQAHDCGARTEPLLSVGMKLAYCGRTREPSRQCTLVNVDEMPMTTDRGEFTVPHLASGEYDAEVYAEGTAVWKQSVTLGGAERRSVAAGFRLRTLRGSVRQGTKGVLARVAFTSGAAVTADSGEFIAPIVQPVHARTPVEVIACDGSFSFTDFVDRELDDGDRFDIMAPGGRLEVQVMSNGTPVPNARVTVGALMPDSDDDSMATLALPPTNRDGVTEKLMLKEGVRYRACATHPDYKRACSDPILVAGPASSTRVVFDAAGTHEGRIVSDKEIVEGRVYFVGPDGTVREDATVASGGSFTVHDAHFAPEYAVLTSRSHPLAVVHLPVDTGGRLEIPIASGPITSFDAVLSPSRSVAVITLQIGRTILPLTIVDRYLAQSGSRAILRTGRTAHFAGILADAPVFVVVGPGRLPENISLDALFFRPEYARLPRLQVQTAVIVIE